MESTSNTTCDMDDESDIQKFHELLRAQDSDNEDDICEDDTDTDASEDFEKRTDDSETEQDNITSNTDDDEYEDNEYFTAYKRKNSKVIDFWKWKKTPFIKRKKAPRNILVKLPGVVGKAKGLKKVMETWSCLIDNGIINDLVKFTNQYIVKLQGEFSRERDVRTTDEVEIRGFIGLLYLLGIYHASRLNLNEIWDSNGGGIEKFRMTMNQKRFQFLMRSLRFDDRDSRSERRSVDRLAPVRAIFEKFVENCQQNYSLGANVTIDEMLVGFRGRCSFKQYIPSKPRKYGIKIFSMVDAKLFYTYNMEIYAGKAQDSYSNKAVDVVKRLVTPIYNTGRNVTMDNWFCDFTLLKELGEKQLSIVGTLKKSKAQIPVAFKITNNRPAYSSLFGFRREGTLLSYVPRKGRNVILLSSLHDDDEIDPESAEKMKPSIITFYNETKAGVDVVDQMSETYNVARNTKRWPMVVFFVILNIAGINSRVLFIGNGNAWISRRKFLRTLSNELTHDLIIRRGTSFLGIPLNIQEKIKRYKDNIKTHNDDVSETATETKTIKTKEDTGTSRKRKRCQVCQSQKKTRLTQYKCDICNKALCLEHLRGFCDTCKDIILS